MVSQNSPASAKDAATTEDPTVSDLVSAVKENLPSGPSSGNYDRRKLKEAAYKLSLALETPGETVQRVAYYPMHTTIVRIANRLKLLHALVKSPTPLSSTELAQAVGADTLLLRRLLRFLVATDVVAEADIDRYKATKITRSLAVPGYEAGINHSYDIVGHATMALPNFLQRTAYQNPTDPKHCAFQDAFQTEDDLFEWFPKHPDQSHTFNLWMTVQRAGRSNWLDFYPLDKKLLSGYKGGNDAVALVDVGGGMGHEIAEIKKRFPSLPGKLILQDLPETVKEALSVPDMQVMAHDFFTEQPVKGAKCYYLRNILHDWPDDSCHAILTQLVAAMTTGYSMLILNEIVVPNKGASLLAVQRDIVMMAVLASTERTEMQWRDMAAKAGLKVESIWTDVPEEESVIVLIKE